MNTSIVTPLEQLHDSLFDEKEIQLFIKRDDLLHSHISGNKWRKLKYNLVEAKSQGQTTLLTFGGAYSNHIYALAAAGIEYGFKTIGIIRGEKLTPFNPTLSFAHECGMELHFISRIIYRLREEPGFIQKLRSQFGDFYLLPEGGSNVLAVKGCTEIVKEIEMHFNYICCPCGTGGTIAGLAAGCSGNHKIIGFSVLKGLMSLEEKVERMIFDFSGRKYDNWSIDHSYHFGGYAKMKPELFSFIQEFKSKHGILLDPVYSGKMMFGIYDLIRKNYFPPGSVIVAVHTGGLQGWGGVGWER